MRQTAALALLLTLLASPAQATTQARVTQVRVEGLENPVATDVAKPAFSWIVTSRERGLSQKSYRIRVAANASAFRNDGPYLWDSGKQQSAAHAHVLYEGAPLWDAICLPQVGRPIVEITGQPHKLGADAVTGVVVSSDLPISGQFTSSDPALNQLQSNVVWSQRANFVSIPTDCPQRDERVGWTADISVFARTAVFNMDAGSFLSKYMIDLADVQKP